MYLKSLILKGFKSFPDRIRLDFGPGVSVVVGPNGSGKSNVTDALLWAMGEQSPLAVRGQSMQDVIFGGGRGVQARSSAEVEIVLDNSDAAVDVPFGEISIMRRLDRSGEGEYRLNGARCRLVDVIEALSDTGLGKETHSVISQGRVEAIVTSRPRDRRLLIEEAAGLGKHRKRRRRAQLKLERTQENLDRALDVEREARTRLKPLKRQAEAAELHERLERQMLEARLELAREAVRATRVELAAAELQVGAARAAREQLQARLEAVVERRSAAESVLAQRTERHDALARRAYELRLAGERLRLRGEQAAATAALLGDRRRRIDAELGALLRAQADSQGEGPSASRGHDAQGASAGEDRVSALARELDEARESHGRASERLENARSGRVWPATWNEVRKLIADGVRRLLTLPAESQREQAVDEVVGEVERLARATVEHALGELSGFEQERDRTGEALRESERRLAEAVQAQHGSERLRAQRARDAELEPRAERFAAALTIVGEAVEGLLTEVEGSLSADRAQGAQVAAELKTCAQEEAAIQASLRAQGEAVTDAEVAAQRLRDRAEEAGHELGEICARLELPVPGEGDEAEPLTEEQKQVHRARLERLRRRREQLGPVNPLAQHEYAEAVAHVEELEARRADLETALRELNAVIRETDRQIHETFNATFAAAARNFEELVPDVFPGGSGRLKLVKDEQARRAVLGGQPLPDGTPVGSAGAAQDAAEQTAAAEAEAEARADAEAQADAEERQGEEDSMGVEIEITPAGKATKRLSLLSGGEKSMTALAFLFAVFLARPCPFYVLDEVEAALDDLNLDRFLTLLRRYADRAQFIVITHQKRTMEAADWLYGVSMADNGVSKVLSRRLPQAELAQGPVASMVDAA